MSKSRVNASKRPKRSTGWGQEPITRPSRRKRGGATPHEFTDDSRGPRLQKILAEAGVGSRRHCEELIAAGEVRVNGHLVQTLPAWVDPVKDHITVGSRRIKTQEPHVYIKLFKPRGVVSTNSDPDGVDYVIPGNDDAIRAVQLYVTAMADACLEGSEYAKTAGPAETDGFVEVSEGEAAAQ